MTLLSAPLELVGDWGVSSTEDAWVVLSRTREVCLKGIRMLSPDQPKELRIESRSSGFPHIWLESPTRAHVVVDGTARDWPRMAYQFGHELGHVLANSWQPDGLPLRPSQWLEEVLVEAFTFRGLAIIADSWEQEPWLKGEGDFPKHLRRYREYLIGGYRNGGAGSKQGLDDWFADNRANVEGGLGGRPAAGPALLMILGELLRDEGCVEDLVALNRWPSRAATALEDYLHLWAESCAELGAPGKLPRRLVEMLFRDESPRPSLRPPTPFVRRPERGEVRQHITTIDDLLALDHPVRAVWAFAEALDLSDLVTEAEAPGHVAPALMMSLWLWASAEGVGSAHHLQRLCAQKMPYRWLCGGVDLDGGVLREFRVLRDGAVDALLARSLAALVEAKAINLALGLRRARKGPKDYGSAVPRSRFDKSVDAAAARIGELRQLLDRDDPVVDERENWGACGHVAERQRARVDAAITHVKEV